MTYEQLCPPNPGFTLDICLSYFFHLMSQVNLLHALIALVILACFMAWLEKQNLGLEDLIMLILFPLLIGPALLSYLWRKWNNWPQPISDEPSYIKQLAPGFVVFGYEGRGYTGGKFAKEEVYRVIRIEEQLLEPPPEGCKENYISDFGRCYLIEQGKVQLSLLKRVYSREDLYLLARWIDVIEGDLKRESER